MRTSFVNVPQAIRQTQLKEVYRNSLAYKLCLSNLSKTTIFDSLTNYTVVEGKSLDKYQVRNTTELSKLHDILCYHTCVKNPTLSTFTISIEIFFIAVYRLLSVGTRLYIIKHRLTCSVRMNNKNVNQRKSLNFCLYVSKLH